MPNFTEGCTKILGALCRITRSVSREGLQVLHRNSRTFKCNFHERCAEILGVLCPISSSVAPKFHWCRAIWDPTTPYVVYIYIYRGKCRLCGSYRYTSKIPNY